MTHFISACCQDERCSLCGEPATHKIGEEIQLDDPNPNRHNLTAYVCCSHFRMLFGDSAPCRDACSICGGEKGGVPGNENIIDGQLVCDYCHAATLRPTLHTALPAPDAITWRAERPTVAELTSGYSDDEYYWVRGGNFNRAIMARVTVGARLVGPAGARKGQAELNFTFMAENCPPYIWDHNLVNWPMLRNLEWAGPVPRPSWPEVADGH